jgi:hypothetical protein
MRRRLDLAASLVGRPRVLYLDEPTTGLDPHSRNEVWGMIRQLAADGTTGEPPPGGCAGDRYAGVRETGTRLRPAQKG